MPITASHSEPTLFIAHSTRSKDKVLRFFGEPSIPMQSGGGSTSKLQAFYGGMGGNTNTARFNRTNNTHHGHNPSSNNGSDVGTISDLDSTISNSKRLSSSSARRWSLPSSPTVIVDGYQTSLSEALADLDTDSVNSGNANAKLKSSQSRALPPLAPHPAVRKLVSILGADARVDVPLREIQLEGLPALLESKLPLCYFLLYLLKEYNSEILFFTLDVQLFEQTLFPSTTAQNVSAQTIFNTYLAPSSLLEVNASHKAKRAVIDGVQQGLRRCFAPAQQEMVVLLDQAFELFKKSPFWSFMESDIGKNVVISKEMVTKYRTHIHNVLSTCYLSNETVASETRRNIALREKVPALLMSRLALTL
ncbi:hypothetical protein HDU76_003173 [Blyttiomyces sp. JEL0837]|nr:hypothetical protein HDU76_003173 [Blyttiomyces sp. JEL0837]